jgi:hypothetical protein
MPPNVLGAMSEAARKLPGSPDYHHPKDVYVPKDPGKRAAALAGLREYLVRIHRKLYEAGVSAKVDSDTGETYWPYDERVSHLLKERERTAGWLHDFGVDITTAEAGIEPGDYPSYERYGDPASGAEEEAESTEERGDEGRA